MEECYRDRYRKLGERIQMYRKLRGLSQEELAEQAGRSASFLSQLEANNGREGKGVSLDSLFAISEALQIPVSCLFEETEGYEVVQEISRLDRKRRNAEENCSADDTVLETLKKKLLR